MFWWFVEMSIFFYIFNKSLISLKHGVFWPKDDWWGMLMLWLISQTHNEPVSFWHQFSQLPCKCVTLTCFFFFGGGGAINLQIRKYHLLTAFLNWLVSVLKAYCMYLFLFNMCSTRCMTSWDSFWLSLAGIQIHVHEYVYCDTYTWLTISYNQVLLFRALDRCKITSSKTMLMINVSISWSLFTFWSVMGPRSEESRSRLVIK